MRRTPLLCLPLLIAAALLVPLSPTTAVAVEETCQGQPATVVGDTGTEGDDVIVSTPTTSVTVRGLGGDDLICVRGDVPKPGYVDIQGGSGDDTLELRLGDQANRVFVEGAEDLDIALGRGRDRLALTSTTGTGSVSAAASGAVLTVHGDRVALDLMTGDLSLDDARYEISGGFTRVSATAARIVILGDRRDNGLRANGCDVAMRGGRGADVMSVRNTLGCDGPRARLFGDQGKDRLEGSSDDDVLIGGPGLDRANGSLGEDKCVAEKEKGCER